MKRRTFLKTVGGLYLANGARLATAHSTDRPGKVVVIGAGMAGLAAAEALRRQGVDVAVVEA